MTSELDYLKFEKLLSAERSAFGSFNEAVMRANTSSDNVNEIDLAVKAYDEWVNVRKPLDDFMVQFRSGDPET